MFDIYNDESVNYVKQLKKDGNLDGLEKILEELLKNFLSEENNETRDKINKNLTFEHSAEFIDKKDKLEHMVNAIYIVSAISEVSKYQAKPTDLNVSKEAVSGAHVILDDGGKLYTRLRDLGVLETRISSHHLKFKLFKKIQKN